MNVAAFSGNLTADPELKTTQSGKSVCSFTVAVKRPGVKDTTDFIDCVAWEKRAEFLCNYFHKGSRIEVSGVMTTRTYGNEGAKRKATELKCDEIGFGERKRDDDQQAVHTAPAGGDFEDITDDDDLPF